MPRPKSIKTYFRVEASALINAINRCTNKNHAQYNDYGGRGISVHSSFLGPDGFKNFMDAVGPKPSPELTLDRVSNDKGYEPGNLAWTTRSVQQRNRRPRKAKVCDMGHGLGAHVIVCKDGRTKTLYSPYVECGERKLTIRQWASELGIQRRTLAQRLQRGLTPEQALVPTLFDTCGKPRDGGPTIH